MLKYKELSIRQDLRLLPTNSPIILNNSQLWVTRRYENKNLWKQQISNGKHHRVENNVISEEMATANNTLNPRELTLWLKGCNAINRRTLSKFLQLTALHCPALHPTNHSISPAENPSVNEQCHKQQSQLHCVQFTQVGKTAKAKSDDNMCSSDKILNRVRR